MSELKKGYTTGVTATFAFKLAFESFLSTRELSVVKSNKMYNDDLDVTKGCEIVVTVCDKKDLLELNKIPHKPYVVENRLYLYAGSGVGVVTKDGLKPPKGFPAINPTPLKAITEVFKKVELDVDIYASISVTD